MQGPSTPSAESCSDAVIMISIMRAAARERHEAVDPETGISRFHNPHVLLDTGGVLHLEPLSRRLLKSRSVEFAGRQRWLPPSLASLEKEGGGELGVASLAEVQRAPVGRIVNCACSGVSHRQALPVERWWA